MRLKEAGKRLLWLMAWHLAAAIVVAALLGMTLGLPVWRLTESDPAPLAVVCLAYLISTLVPSAAWLTQSDGFRWSTVLITFLIAFVVVEYLPHMLVILNIEHVRRLLLGIGVITNLMLTLAPARPGVSLAGAWVAGALTLAPALVLYHHSSPISDGKSVALARVLDTGVYAIDYRLFRGAWPASTGQGGALAAYKGNVILMNGDGRFFLLTLSAGLDRIDVRPLALQAPMNQQAFLRRRDDPASAWKFASLDFMLLRGSEAGREQVLVSHHYWNDERGCYVLRLSRTETSLEQLLAEGQPARWKTVYDTRPCLSLEQGKFSLFNGHQGGGRLVQMDEGHVLLSVGDFSFDGIHGLGTVVSSDPDSDYGKTIRVNLANGEAEIYSLGHRNPQGLFRDAEGTIWSTEQGPKGGDELNIIFPGRNYGWPFKSEGTDYARYESHVTTVEPPKGEFEDPVYSWSPSVGIGDVIRIEHGPFAKWQGDLVIASLRARSLFRVRTAHRRVVLIEPIEVSERIRDVIQDEQGRLILWTDSSAIGVLRPSQQVPTGGKPSVPPS